MSGQRRPGVVTALRRYEDPAQSSDPRIRSLVASLADLDFAPAPEPAFRAELRAQLVAVAPRIIAESRDAELAEAASGAQRAPITSPTRRRRRLGRPLGVAAGVAAAFVMLFGAALWMSQRSLPGDALYGLKRASENVRLDLASSGTDRGHVYLSLAQSRVEEARALLHRNDALAGGGTLAGGRLSPGTASLITSTLDAADADLADGSSQLDKQAVSSGSDNPLTIMQRWAPGQLARLHELLVALPSGPVQSRTKTSWQLTSSALTRARTLAPALHNPCLQHAASDKLGPLPCSAGSSATPAGTGPNGGVVPTRSGPGTTPRTGGNTGAGPTATRNTASRSPQATAHPAPPAPSASAGRPELPLPLPTKPPLTVNSCGISVALGPLGLGIGTCPTTP